MLKIDLIPYSNIAALLVFVVNAGSSELTVAQQYYSRSSAGAYTQIGQGAVAPPRSAAYAAPPVQQTRATGPIMTVASQPVVTSVQAGPAYASPQFPLTAAGYAQPANSWAGATMSYPQPSGQPAYCYGAGYPEYSYSYDRGKCDWYCRAQKKLRSLCRASHRRSECEFEYPVMFPSGSPYGYVEPTWSRFCDTPGAQVIGPSY